MPERVFPLLAVALTAVGCSVLVNTDFSGGTEPAASNKGGQGGDTVVEAGGSLFGSGGTLGDGGSISEGGDANATGDAGSGNGPATGGSSGNAAAGGTGGDTAGAPDGNAGETSGGTGGDMAAGGTSGGLAGSGGGGVGGMSGSGLGGAGSGGVAGSSVAGMSGAGTAGGPSCSADLMTDPLHCGSCDKACDDGIDCEGGICITSPCVGLCSTPSMITKKSDGYREDNLPGTEACFETTLYSVTPPALPSFICWNVKDRTVQVNGVTMANGTTVQCQGDPGAAVPATRAGGYCVHVTASKSNDTTDGFKFPVPGELMPH